MIRRGLNKNIGVQSLEDRKFHRQIGTGILTGSVQYVRPDRNFLVDGDRVQEGNWTLNGWVSALGELLNRRCTAAMPNVETEFLEEMWRFERRPDGVYVSIEEIGGQGELGPFSDHAAAREALISYLTYTALHDDQS